MSSKLAGFLFTISGNVYGDGKLSRGRLRDGDECCALLLPDALDVFVRVIALVVVDDEGDFMDDDECSTLGAIAANSIVCVVGTFRL